MHFLKPETLLAALGRVFVYLFAGKILTLRTEHDVPFLAALPYTAALAELVAVGGYGAAAAAGYVLGIKFPLLGGIFVGKVFSHCIIVPLCCDIDGAFIAHYSAA